MSTLNEYRILPSDKYVRALGRTDFNGEYRLLALSGTAIEFSYFGTTCKVALLGDSTTEPGVQSVKDQAYIGVYVDGHMQIKTVVKQPREEFFVLRADEAGEPAEHIIRIIKLSEAAMSCVAIESITVVADSEPKPTPAPAKRIEFIGDSITCGYGVEMEDEWVHFNTTTENVTKAFGYLAAKELNLDYSMVSFSGHGLISGYTPDCAVINDKELVPPYYEKLGYSYNSFNGRKLQQELWDFNKWQPDVIVINLGTNDHSYTGDNPARIEKYEKLYVDFLGMVRKNNPKAHIICALGIMGDELYPAVERVVNSYSSLNGDTNISSLHLTPQNASINGYSADYHPSPATQKIAAAELVAELKKWL